MGVQIWCSACVGRKMSAAWTERTAPVRSSSEGGLGGSEMTASATRGRCLRRRRRVSGEVANFYPAIALGLSRRLYKATQSHIHVIVTHGFLRSLARLDLAESRVGRFGR